MSIKYTFFFHVLSSSVKWRQSSFPPYLPLFFHETSNNFLVFVLLLSKQIQTVFPRFSPLSRFITFAFALLSFLYSFLILKADTKHDGNLMEIWSFPLAEWKYSNGQKVSSETSHICIELAGVIPLGIHSLFSFFSEEFFLILLYRNYSFCFLIFTLHFRVRTQIDDQ